MKKFNRAAFYFVAHADDWQLFMTPEINKDIADKKCRVVIIHATAGDAGKDKKYWKAREYAAMDSLLFSISTDNKVSVRTIKPLVGEKRINTCIASNCVCYFLRLPDGNYNGSGFSNYDHESLEKLRTGIIPTLSTVDKESLYVNWDDLSDTIDLIIEKELVSTTVKDAADICLSFPEHDRDLNPNDHNDHFNTSMLVQHTKAYRKYKRRAFLHYQLINTSELLAGEDLFWKIGMFCSYHQSLFKRYGHSTIAEDQSFIPWCFKRSSYRDL